METRKLYIPLTVILPEKISFTMCKKEDGTFEAVYTEEIGKDVSESVSSKSAEIFRLLFPQTLMTVEDNKMTLTFNYTDRKLTFWGIIFELIVQCCENRQELEKLVSEIRLMLPEAAFNFSNKLIPLRGI